MPQKKLFPLRRLLPTEQGEIPDLYQNQVVMQLFYNYFPLLMREARKCIEAGTPEQNLVALFGITIPGAWLTRVFLCLRRVEKILQKSGLPEAEIPYLAQVKEKWGDLRIYLSCDSELYAKNGHPVYIQIDEIISQCEMRFMNSEDMGR